MISFSDLNSVKITNDNTSILPNYRNRNYQDYGVGVNQRYAYSKCVPCIIFNSGDTITLQIKSDDSLVYIEVFNNGSYTTYGNLSSPINGATSTTVAADIYDFTIPVDFSGETFIRVYDYNAGIRYYSETFFVSEDVFSSSFDNYLLDIQYKNRTGYENGYYWTNYYQRIKVEEAHLTDTDIDVNRETTESVRKEPLVLDSSTLEWDEYTLKNIPEYLAKKIVKASSQTDILVRGVPMVYKDHSFGDKRDGRIDLTISYTQSNVTNNY